MDLSDLRIFTAVVREGGITRAAERLHRVQSNVTTRIRQLEEDLDVRLFDRKGKKLHLTPTGQTLLGYADQLLALADEARAALHDDRPRGQFKLGAMESTAAVRLPGPLTDYAKRYPDVVLELRTGNPTQLATAVLAGEIDAALVAEPVAQAKFDSRVAFDEEPVIVTSKDHPAIDDAGAESVGGLIDIERADETQVLTESNAVIVGVRVARIEDTVRDQSEDSRFDRAIQSTDERREVVLDACEVHLLETRDEQGASGVAQVRLRGDRG